MRHFGLSLAALLSISVFTSCSQPATTTEVAAVTGGVAGAGLGAIIGSTTGDAGGGLVIGALAGTATGAAVGTALESQEGSIQSQESALERQQRIIDSQKAEIAELRNRNEELGLGGPRASYRSQARVGGSRAVGRSTGGVAPQVNERTLVDMPPRARAAESRGTVASQRRAANSYGIERGVDPIVDRSRYENAVNNERIETTPYQPNRIETSSSGSDILDSQIGTRRRVPGPSRIIKDTDVGGVTVVEPTLPSVNAAVAGMNEESIPVAEPMQRGMGEMASEVTASGRIAAPILSAECQKGQSEAVKAQSASDDPDKLFHLRRALRLCPEEPSFHVMLGKVYLTLDRKIDAEYEFREALELAPGDVQAKEQLALLGQ